MCYNDASLSASDELDQFAKTSGTRTNYNYWNYCGLYFTCKKHNHRWYSNQGSECISIFLSLTSVSEDSIKNLDLNNRIQEINLLKILLFLVLISSHLVLIYLVRI